jgi:hypothetical protein
MHILSFHYNIQVAIVAWHVKFGVAIDYVYTYPQISNEIRWKAQMCLRYRSLESQLQNI